MDASLIFEDLTRRVERVINDKDAINNGVKVMADTLMVASAAPYLDEKSLRVAGAFATKSSGRHAILGLGVRVGIIEAVAINSYLAHALELDDWLPLGYVHAGAVVVPSTLAASIEAGSSLEDAARSIAVGYEVAGFLGALLGREHYNVWHTTATAGAAGAAAAFTLAYGLDVEASLEAAALALNYMGGLWEAAKGGIVKPFSAMHAATLGVEAALTVIVGGRVQPSRIIEAVCKAFGCSNVLSLPEQPLIGYSRLKFYSACYHSHSAIKAAEDVVGQIKGADIERVVVRTYREAVEIAGITRPGNVEEAKFSIPFLVALTLFGRKPLPGAIRDSLSDERILGLAAKVLLKVDPSLDSLYPRLMPARLEIYSGRGKLVVRVDMPPKTLVSEVGRDAILGKAVDLARDSGTSDPKRVAHAFLEAKPSEPVEAIINNVLEKRNLK